MTTTIPLKTTTYTLDACAEESVPESGQTPTQGVGSGVGSAPGFEVPPPDCPKPETVKARAREKASSSLLYKGSSPVLSGGRAVERPDAHSTTREGSSRYAAALSPERLEFRRLFLAGRMAEARRLAERLCEVGLERVAWVNNLGNVAREQSSLREAYSLYLTNSHLLDSCPDLYDAANYSLTFGMVSQELGLWHGVREYLDRSLHCYREAARLYELAGAPSCVAYAESNTGWLYATCTETPERAHAHLDAAQLLFNDSGETARVADVWDTKALAYEAEGKVEEAFECSHRAVVMLARFGDAERKSFETACETHERLFSLVRGKND
jgi:tetratricopeptide (TPR) repeat protein